MNQGQKKPVRVSLDAERSRFGFKSKINPTDKDPSSRQTLPAEFCPESYEIPPQGGPKLLRTPIKSPNAPSHGVRVGEEGADARICRTKPKTQQKLDARASNLDRRASGAAAWLGGRGGVARRRRSGRRGRSEAVGNAEAHLRRRHAPARAGPEHGGRKRGAGGVGALVWSAFGAVLLFLGNCALFFGGRASRRTQKSSS